MVASGLGPLGDLGARDMKVYQRTFSDAQLGLRAATDWYIERGGMVMDHSLGRLHGDHHRERYLLERDEWRRERGDPPEWEGITMRHAAGLGSGFGLGQRARRNRLIMDKHWDGRNEGKGSGAVLRCPLCGDEDGQLHWVCECTDGSLAELRSAVVRDLNRVLTEFCVTAALVMVRFAEVVRRVLFEGGNRHRTWCGLWTREQVDALRPVVRCMVQEDRKKARGLLRAVGKITQKGSLDMWDERSRRIKGGALVHEEGARAVDSVEGMRTCMMRWLVRERDGMDYG